MNGKSTKTRTWPLVADAAVLACVSNCGDTHMKSLRRLTLTLVLGMSLLLTACSKTVHWEEEVLLNTGETIWVQRSATYTYQGGTGNPLDMAYRIEGAPTLEFTYDNKKYSFRERAGLMVLAISPQKTPVLVMPATSGGWDAVHQYKCTYPFYVQFVPDVTGQVWSWPTSIEPWLYELRTNLFADYGTPERMLPRYSREQKSNQKYLNDPQLIFAHKIDPAYTGDLCKRKEK